MSQRDPGLVDFFGNRHCYYCGRFVPTAGMHGCPVGENGKRLRARRKALQRAKARGGRKGSK
jgi:hypothetical protein